MQLKDLNIPKFYKEESLDKVALNREIISSEIEKEDIKQRIKKLNSSPSASEEDKNKEKTGLIDKSLYLEKLHELKGLEDKIFNVKQQQYNAKGITTKSDKPEEKSSGT